MKKILIGGKNIYKKYFIIDDEDFEWISKYKWHLNKNYLIHHDKINRNKSIYLHKEIMNCPKGMEVDHINHDLLDNRKCNLRICTRLENCKNTRGWKKNKCGFKGIYFDKTTKKYRSRIMFNYDRKSLGAYKTAIEAAKAYNDAAIKYHGKFAFINKI